ncbi:MAG: hypothetical protein LUE08_06775 [Akkermansiaceae bacterium]|nr:hypothetical protein [Akkermansiaceae bacterium]
MMKKTIFAACAVLLVSAFVSRQKKSDVEQYMDTQKEMIELMENIREQDSAEKCAGKLAALRKKAGELQNSMSDEGNNEEYFKLLFRKEALKQALFNKDYYGSFELRQAAFMPARALISSVSRRFWHPQSLHGKH